MEDVVMSKKSLVMMSVTVVVKGEDEVKKLPVRVQPNPLGQCWEKAKG